MTSSCFTGPLLWSHPSAPALSSPTEGDNLPKPSSSSKPEPDQQAHTKSVPKSDSKLRNDNFHEAFEKMMKSNYRKTNKPYERVGLLCLTWKDDDMQCKETEVDKLCEIFAKNFGYETKSFEIPSEQSETALFKEMATFFHEYNRQDNLAILYYGGHAYTGKTGKFTLSAKYKRDENGHPKVYYDNLLSNLGSPHCDQILIMDCCFASRAYSPSFNGGKRKFELLASAGKKERCDIPKMPGSFTRRLNEWLVKLLNSNPEGFSLYKLYSELYHADPDAEPRHFNLAQYEYGNIQLRPQNLPEPTTESKQATCYVSLRLRLRQMSKPAHMQELASSLSFLPHVENIILENIDDPAETMFADFQSTASNVRPAPVYIRVRLQGRKLLKAAYMNEVTFGLGFLPYVEEIILVDIYDPKEIMLTEFEKTATVVRRLLPLKRMLKAIRERKARQADLDGASEPPKPSHLAQRLLDSPLIDVDTALEASWSFSLSRQRSDRDEFVENLLRHSSMEILSNDPHVPDSPIKDEIHESSENCTTPSLSTDQCSTIKRHQPWPFLEYPRKQLRSTTFVSRLLAALLSAVLISYLFFKGGSIPS